MGWNKLWAMNKAHTVIKELVNPTELIQCSNIFILFFCVAVFSVAQMPFGRRKGFVLLLKMDSRVE